MSGSSQVSAVGEQFLVMKRSPSMNFRMSPPGTERDYHERWKKKHQGNIDKLAQQMGVVLAACCAANQEVRLGQYKENAREVLHGSTSEELRFENEQGGPFRYVVTFGSKPAALLGIRLELAFDELPKKTLLRALVAEIVKGFKARK